MATKQKSPKITLGTALLLLVIVFVICAFAGGLPLLMQKDETITVTRRERSVNGNTSKYLIWGKYSDGTEETFECVDSMYFFKFNSSDVYGKLTDGDTFKVHVAGFRFGPTSSYRNIISAEKAVSSSPPGPK